MKELEVKVTAAALNRAEVAARARKRGAGEGKSGHMKKPRFERYPVKAEVRQGGGAGGGTPGVTATAMGTGGPGWVPTKNPPEDVPDVVLKKPRPSPELVAARLACVDVEHLRDCLQGAIDDASAMAGSMDPADMDAHRAFLDGLSETVDFLFGPPRKVRS